MTDRRPHTLHLTIGADGWITWTLDCPYGDDEHPNGRHCNLVDLDEDTGDGPPFIPGCFAAHYLDAAGWDDALHLAVEDPTFPLLVDVKVEGSWDDAWAALAPWEPA